MLLIEQVSRLIDILSGEKGLYSELIALSKQKKDAISGSKIKELDGIVTQEHAKLMKLLEWERRRKACVAEIAGKKNLSGTGFSLDNVIDVATHEQQTQLKELHKELSALILEQKELNDTNRSLLEDRLEYINFMMSTMAPASEQAYTYGARGVGYQIGGPKTNILDSKA